MQELKQRIIIGNIVKAPFEKPVLGPFTRARYDNPIYISFPRFLSMAHISRVFLNKGSCISCADSIRLHHNDHAAETVEKSRALIWTPNS